ncbi:MAG: hypothetical protein HZA89_04400, partial [Verrucomicrobia bacterium]|nr:hypothetical protein [Verrucomicrobiota bacterium]
MARAPMIDPQLQARLEPLARRHRALQLARALAVCWGLGSLAALALLSLQKFSGTGWKWAWTIPAALAALAALWLIRKIYSAPMDYRWLARQIEERNPELHALLLTAIEQTAPDGQLLGYLQRRVIHEAMDKADTQNWAGLLPRSRVFTAHVIQFGALALFVAMLGSLPVAHRRAVAERAIQAGISVTPGDASVERGDSLVVLARFTGPLPAGVSLVIGQNADSARRVPLVKSLDDPVFGGSVPEVAEDFVYHLEYGRLKTREFKVSVFEHPKLERSDVRLEFPAYTGQPEKRIEDTRRVTAVEGTKLELSLQLNKPVASARLVTKDKSVKNSIPLKVEAGKATAELKEFPLKASQTYELQLVDADGRTNKSPAQFVFDVLKIRAP